MSDNLIGGGGASAADVEELQTLVGVLSSTGLKTFGDGTDAALSVNTDTTKFDVGPIDGYIVDATVTPTLTTHVLRSATTAETTPFLATDNVTHIGVNASGTIMTQATPFTDTQSRSIIPLGVVAHPDLSTITVTNARPATIQSPVNQLHDFIRGVQEVRFSGLKYSANGTNLKLDRTAGTLFGIGIQHTATLNPIDNPNTLPLSAETVVTNMLYVASDNSNTAIVSDNLIPTQYDPNGDIDNLVTVGNNQFTIQYIVAFAEGRTNVQFGQTEYGSLAAGRDAIENEPYILASVIADNAIVLAAIVMKKETTALNNASEVFIKNFGTFGGNIL